MLWMLAYSLLEHFDRLLTSSGRKKGPGVRPLDVEVVRLLFGGILELR